MPFSSMVWVRHLSWSSMSFANDVASILGDAGLDVAFKKLGNYMTSIDMAGLSLTLMKIAEDAWLEALESPVKTIAW